MFGVSRVTVRGATRESSCAGSSSAGPPPRGCAAPRCVTVVVHAECAWSIISQLHRHMNVETLSVENIARTLRSRGSLAAGRLNFVRIEGRAVRSKRPAGLSFDDLRAGRLCGGRPSLRRHGRLTRRGAVVAIGRDHRRGAPGYRSGVSPTRQEATPLQARPQDAAITAWRWYCSIPRLLLASRSLFPKDRYTYALPAPAPPSHRCIAGLSPREAEPYDQRTRRRARRVR